MNLAALGRAKREFLGQQNVLGVGWGYRQANGQRTNEESIVVLVGEKIADLGLLRRRGFALLPRLLDGELVDVQERGEIVPHQLTGRYRPVPPGVSVGNVRITAGTVGFYANRNGEFVMVSNNHVLAASNDGVIGDDIIQPGKADGGFSGSDRAARLSDYVTINFPGGGTFPPSPSDCDSFEGRLMWAAFHRFANHAAEVYDLPFKLERRKSKRYRQVGVQAINQPTPNRVDCAMATMMGASAQLETLLIQRKWETLDVAKLGDRVEKVGRTTEHTRGRVTLIDAAIQVNYGTPGVAEFDGQIGIEADAGEFSAGGDSGSSIFYEGSPALIGLLFAGGGGQTFANPIHDVFRLLGLDTEAP